MNCFFFRRIVPSYVMIVSDGMELSIPISMNSTNSSLVILPLISRILPEPSSITELIPIRAGHQRLFCHGGHLHSTIHLISLINSSFWYLSSSMSRVPIKNASNKSKNVKAPITNIDMSRRSVWRREVSFSSLFSLQKNAYTFFRYCFLFFQCMRQEDVILNSSCFIEGLCIEAISDSLVCLDDVSSDLLAEVSDVDFDDFLICPCIIDSPDLFCEFGF